jgi:hypothetical protein
MSELNNNTDCSKQMPSQHTRSDSGVQHVSDKFPDFTRITFHKFLAPNRQRHARSWERIFRTRTSCESCSRRKVACIKEGAAGRISCGECRRRKEKCSWVPGTSRGSPSVFVSQPDITGIATPSEYGSSSDVLAGWMSNGKSITSLAGI